MVYLHCTVSKGPKETMDQRVYREAFNKSVAIGRVERVMAEAATDCGLYERRVARFPKSVESSQGPATTGRRRAASTRPVCDIKWASPETRADDSTVHPFIYKNLVDLLAFEIKDLLEARLSATFDEIASALRADAVVLSLALTTLMNPLLSWRWLGKKSVVYRGSVYIIVPSHMADGTFTIVEARRGFMFSDNPSSRIH